MEIWGNKRLYVFFKILMSLVLPMVFANIFAVFIREFLNLQLYQTNDKYVYAFAILISFIWALVTFKSYLFNSKSIKIDDILLAKENIKFIMKKKKWKTIELDENIFTYKKSFLREFKSFKITIRFIDTEVIIAGPEQYVDEIIEMMSTESL